MKRLAVLLLAACKTPAPVADAAIDVGAVSVSAFGCEGMSDDPTALYKKANDLIEPYATLQNHPRNDADSREKSLKGGIACLDRVIGPNPKSWSAMWLRGKAWQALGEHPKARDDFRAAYAIKPDELDVGRELGLELLATNEFAESKKIWDALIKHWPDNSGLHANEAIALALLGDTPGAQREVKTARTLDPSDPVTKELELRIADVASGARRPPVSLEDLQNRTLADAGPAIRPLLHRDAGKNE